MNENYRALHEETVKLVNEERRLTGLVIANLQKIQDTKLYLEMGYSSLFEYAVKALGYSESCAYRRIAAVKVTRTIPEIRAKLDSGSLNLTNLAMAQSFFARERVDFAKQREVLDKIENRSKRETEKILAEVFGAAGPAKTEQIISVAGDEAVLQVKLPQTTVNKLDRLKSLRAHKNPKMTYGELIEDMCEYMLKRVDRSRSAKSSKRAAVSKKTVNARYIPADVRRLVWRRDAGQCAFRDLQSGRRCESQHLLQVDHIRPVEHGGVATPENLRLLCHAHHRLRETERG